MLVTSDPTGATVTVDSVAIGVTPIDAELRRKRPHVLTVAHPSAAAETLEVFPTETAGAFYWNLVSVGFFFIPVDLLNGASRAFPERTLHFDLVRRVSAAASDSAAAQPATPGRMDASRDSSAIAASPAEPASTDAAPWLDVPWGARVRVRAGGGLPPVVGRFTGLLGDTLVVETNRNRPATRRLRGDVRSVDLSLGSNRVRGAVRGAGVGAVLGFGAFALLGALDGAGMGLFLGFIGTIYGLPAGAVYGFLAIPSDDWMRVYEWAP